MNPRKPQTAQNKHRKIVQNKQRSIILRKKIQEVQRTKHAEKIDNLTSDNQRMEMARKINKSSAKKAKIIPPSIFIAPRIVAVQVPEWFTSPQNVEVSIIVPMYRSNQHIKKQIENWDFTDDGIKKEIIYLDDFCPNQSYLQVLESWEKQKLKSPNGIGQIIRHDRNGGFAFACNSGAKFASGKYLIFLNADCQVTPNWVKPMIDLMESNPMVGIVGNLQLNPNGRVDSAGSEWVYNSFKHIGRNTYQGKILQTAFNYRDMPKELKVVGERQMVTGACFTIKNDIFKRIQGFDIGYRIGYWEDADLNMKVKSLGLKIYYQPDSIIYHKVGHSKAGGHRFMSQNHELFLSKWALKNNFKKLLNGQITPLTPTVPAPVPISAGVPVPVPPVAVVSTIGDLKKKVAGNIVGCVIACNEEEFIKASVESLVPIIDKWIFVIGGNEYAYKSGMCNQNGHPTDNTMDIVKNLASQYNGTVIEPHGVWKNKIDMRNAYAKLLKPGDWMFLQDADEVYDEKQLETILQLMIRQHSVIRMQYWSFWNNVHTLGTGKWDTYPCERIVKWQTGFGYNKSHLNVNTKDGSLIMSNARNQWASNERLFYHYSWIRPVEKLRQKLLYYKYQSGNNNDSYIDEVFLKWRTNPKSVKGKTHPMGGGDYAPFLGKHPPQVEKLIKEGKLDF